MFARSTAFVSISRRKVDISGELDRDYSYDPVQSVIKLHTSDKEQLKKGGWTAIELVSQVKPNKNVLMVEPHEDLLAGSVLTGIRILDKYSSGRIVFHVKPNKDIDLLSLPYICKIYIEREAV